MAADAECGVADGDGLVVEVWVLWVEGEEGKARGKIGERLEMGAFMAFLLELREAGSVAK